VPPDPLGSVASHDADYQSTDNWHQDYEDAQRVQRGRFVLPTPGMKEEKIGEEINQPQQDQREVRADDTNHNADQRKGNDSKISSEIS
jgi:hypothetical protein